MNEKQTLEEVMAYWLIAEEARAVVAEIIHYEDYDDMKCALGIVADECYWRDPNQARYDSNRIRFPYVSAAEEARIRSSLTSANQIGDFLKMEI